LSLKKPPLCPFLFGPSRVCGLASPWSASKNHRTAGNHKNVFFSLIRNIPFSLQEVQKPTLVADLSWPMYNRHFPHREVALPFRTQRVCCMNSYPPFVFVELATANCPEGVDITPSPPPFPPWSNGIPALPFGPQMFVIKNHCIFFDTMFLVNCFTHLTRKAVEDVEEGFATCPHVLPAFCASPTGAPPLLLPGGLWRGTPRGGGWWSGLFEAEGTTPRESSSSFPPQLPGPSPSTT